MNAIIHLLILALDIYLWLVIASVVASWLVAFDVLNRRNKYVYQAYTLLNRAVEPAMTFLRRYIPPIGGIDLTPIVIMFGIYILQGFLYGLLG
jgi:YggT family protein